MITNEEKMEMVLNKLNNLEALIKSLIDNADICKDKYVLEDELLECNRKKTALLNEKEALTNQG
jgi:hypothetical protein